MTTYHLVKFGWPAETIAGALRLIAIELRYRRLVAGH